MDWLQSKILLKNILVVGANTVSKRLAKELRFYNHYFVIEADFSFNTSEDTAHEKSLSEVKTLEQWKKFLFDNKIDKIINCSQFNSFETSDELYETKLNMVDACQPLGIQYVHLTHMFLDLRKENLLKLSELEREMVERENNFVDELYLLQKISVIKTDYVYDPDSASGAFLTSLALSPVILEIAGVQKLHLLHVLDVINEVMRLIKMDTDYGFEEYAISAKSAISFGDLLNSLRKSMGLKNGYKLSLPKIVVKSICGVGSVLGLEQINLKNYKKTFEIPCMVPDREIDSKRNFYANENVFDKIQAKWLYWFARYTLSFLWIWSGLSAVFSDHTEYINLLEKVATSLGSVFVVEALSSINLSLGVLTLIMNSKHTRTLWFVQFVVILFYTAATMFYAVELINDPLAPITKNFSILALLLYLIQQERIGIKSRSLN